MYLSITGATSANKLAKYQPFVLEADAIAHAATYNGFSILDPGGDQAFWIVDMVAKTVTIDTSAQTAAALADAQKTKTNAIDTLKNTKLYAGITYLGKSFSCSDMDVGGIAGKLENLKRENAGTARTITGVTLTNPVVVTSVAHGFRNLDRINFSGVGGTVELTGIYPIGNVAADTCELTGVDGTAWTAFTSGGTASLMCRWTGIDNTINDYSSAQFTTLTNAMNNFNDLCFNRARTMKNEVSALTSTASVSAYDSTVGWPPNAY